VADVPPQRFDTPLISRWNPKSICNRKDSPTSDSRMGSAAGDHGSDEPGAGPVPSRWTRGPLVGPGLTSAESTEFRPQAAGAMVAGTEARGLSAGGCAATLSLSERGEVRTTALRRRRPWMADASGPGSPLKSGARHRPVGFLCGFTAWKAVRRLFHRLLERPRMAGA
jgi:hypothetical protein